MPDRKIVISLTTADIQAVEQAVLDRDRDAAPDLLERVVRSQVQRALTKGHCRPAFELERGKRSDRREAASFGQGDREVGAA